MRKTVVVLGLGLFGSAVARTLARNNVDVIAIDMNMDHVTEVADIVEHAVQADFTKLDQLRLAGVEVCDSAVVATGEKLEITILGILNLKKLGISNIIVKTKNLNYREVLMKIGASRVVLPELESGEKLAHEISNADILDLFALDERYHIMEIHAIPQWYNQRINQLNLRQRYGFNIIAMKTKQSTSYTISINPDHSVSEGDLFLVLSDHDLKDMKLILNQKEKKIHT